MYKDSYCIIGGSITLFGQFTVKPFMSCEHAGVKYQNLKIIST